MAVINYFNVMTAMNPFKLERGKFQSLVNLGK